MAGIAQNRQKRLIFIVAPQIKNENERKVFKQEKKHARLQIPQIQK